MRIGARCPIGSRGGASLLLPSACGVGIASAILSHFTFAARGRITLYRPNQRSAGCDDVAQPLDRQSDLAFSIK
ncbi:hypothetical protein V473_02510 [Sphingobium cupriresistens LL01]|nr:hypothetical protein V473_02510 [Sphingobium cupriresistens LL01]